jgi:DNA-binding PadR family transcriptional regulator
MFGQGDLKLLLLALIADQPSHGYDLIRTIEARFGGNYAPSPGAIYPTLTLLEEQDLIATAADGGSKKSYAATDKGRAFLSENAEAVKELMARIEAVAEADTGGAPPESVAQAMIRLRHAILGKPGGWGEEEAGRVREVLEEAARKLVARS